MIADKQIFMAAFMEGRFGNRLRTWRTIYALGSSGYEGPVSVRSMTPDNRNTRYGVKQVDLPAVLYELSKKGMNLNDLYFNESAPDDRLTIQGEYRPETHYLMCSREQTQMKRVQKWEHIEGVRALLLLQQSMTSDSWDDLNILIDQYPDHMIEFSCYDYNLGDCPGRNTIIWEVRKY